MYAFVVSHGASDQHLIVDHYHDFVKEWACVCVAQVTFVNQIFDRNSKKVALNAISRCDKSNTCTYGHQGCLTKEAY